MDYKTLKKVDVFLKSDKKVLGKVKAILVDSLKGQIKALQVNHKLISWDDLLVQEDVQVLKRRKKLTQQNGLFDIMHYRVITLNEQELGILENYEFDEVSGRIFRYFVKPNSLLKKVIEGSLILTFKDIIRIKPEEKEIVVRDIKEDTKFIKVFKFNKAPAEVAGTV